MPDSPGKTANTHIKSEIIRQVKPKPHSRNGFLLDEK